MKAPLSWLREYVDIPVGPDELADRLTMIGLEVGSVEQVGVNAEGIVAGRIDSVEPHPNSGRLRICVVHDGEREWRVVCGAPNAVPGMMAPFARPGSSLATGVTIRHTVIRGEKSEGMLCSAKEIGAGDDHSGLMQLPADTEPGTPIGKVLSLPDAVLDIDVTWNRPDCLSIMGVAREIAALFRRPFRMPDISFAEAGNPVETLASVEIEDAGCCPRYTARIVRGVVVGPSPGWMQRRLALCGVRPISNVVDVTNYVMLECGHPLHAFDYRLIDGRKIVVRRARPGERIKTLDSVERLLSSDVLVIADARRPVAVAGIMGGAGTEIRDDTTDVLLESAAFDPAVIRRGSLALGLGSESSHRFERGVPAEMVDEAGRRAVHLIARVCGGSVARGVLDAYPGRVARKAVRCRFSRVRDLLGIDIGGDRIVEILKSLDFTVTESSSEECCAQPPPFRVDVELEADLIEEVARLHGLDKVPEAVPSAKVAPDASDAPFRAVAACRGNLAALGLREIMNYSFISGAMLDMFGIESNRRVKLPNPVSSDHAFLRPSLVPQMVETLGRNISRQICDAGLFEIGRVFEREQTGRICERLMVCAGLMGRVGRTGPDMRGPVDREEMFLGLKGVLEGLLRAQKAQPHSWKHSANPAFEEGWCVSLVVDGRARGTMGILRSSIRKEWRMDEPVAVAEIESEPLLENVFRTPAAADVGAYPSVSRDVAMIVSEDVTHESVVACIRRAGPPELTSVVLFDIYRGDAIGPARKSMAYSLVYQSKDRTLTDEEANEFHEKVKQVLRMELGAQIREA